MPLVFFSSPNFTFTCPSCFLNTSSNASTTVSSHTVISTPRSIAIHRNNPTIRPPIPAKLRVPKFMELTTFPTSFINAFAINLSLIINRMHLLLYHFRLLPLLYLLSSTLYLIILPHHIPPTIQCQRQLNNIIRNNSLVIEHLKLSDMNTEFISSILIQCYCLKYLFL